MDIVLGVAVALAIIFVVLLITRLRTDQQHRRKALKTTEAVAIINKIRREVKDKEISEDVDVRYMQESVYRASSISRYSRPPQTEYVCLVLEDTEGKEKPLLLIRIPPLSERDISVNVLNSLLSKRYTNLMARRRKDSILFIPILDIREMVV
jgi:hypothetical protein